MMSKTAIQLLAIFWAALSQLPAQSKLEVHEWGTFTTITIGDGSMINWRPLEVKSDLPTFVHTAPAGPKVKAYGTLRMETPVIYFHTESAMSVDVRVAFPKGRITEWYPQLSPTRAGIQGDEWLGLEVLPAVQLDLPKDSEGSHYYAARAVDAATLRMTQKDRVEHEKFIFYRGVGSPELPLEARLQDDMVRLKNLGTDNFHYIVFENRAGKTAYGVYGLADEKNDIPVPRPLQSAITWDGLDHRGALRKLILGAGLFEDEADAMLATWDDDWFEPGLRVFWMVPRPYVDQILPLTITPNPAKTERVFVGRIEILTPEFRAQVKAAVGALIDQDDQKPLMALSRFAEPLLADLVGQKMDSRILNAIEAFRSQTKVEAAD